MSDPSRKASLTRIARPLGVGVFPVRVASRPRLDVVVVSKVPVARQQTHESLARVLGIPCGSRLAYEDTSLCHAFIVFLRPLDMCRTVYKNVVTSFWCSSLAEGKAWCREFARKATAYERNVLVPRGLAFGYRHDSPVL
jgi:hypothetical protein